MKLCIFFLFFPPLFDIPHPGLLIPTGEHAAPQGDRGETGRGRTGGGEDARPGSPPESRGAEAPKGEKRGGGGGADGGAQPSRRPDEPGAGGAAR